MNHLRSRIAVLKWLVTLLVVALLLLDLTLFGYFYSIHQVQSLDLQSRIVIGFLLGQVSIICVGVVWGKSRLLVRAVLASVFMNGLAFIGGAISESLVDSPRLIRAFLTMELMMILIPFGLARLLGVRLELQEDSYGNSISTNQETHAASPTLQHTSPPSRFRSATRQFTVSGLLSMTVIVAVIVAVMNVNEFWAQLRIAKIATFLFVAFTAVISWSLMLSLNDKRLAIAVTFATCLLLSFSMMLGDGICFVFKDDFAVNVSNGITAALAAGVLRVGGVRIEWPTRTFRSV